MTAVRIRSSHVRVEVLRLEHASHLLGSVTLMRSVLTVAYSKSPGRFSATSFAVVAAIVLGACAPPVAAREVVTPSRPTPTEIAPEAAPPVVDPSFAGLRKAFHTRILGDRREGGNPDAFAPPAIPPKSIFNRVQYPSSVGPLWAYVTPAPATPARLPAIVWAVGGFSNSVDDDAIHPGPVENDQSAFAFRDAGIVLMLPSYRGGNDNPGAYEELYGEVDDFVAAIEYVRALPYVDPERVYIGGHSTGGTLVLLASELSSHFRAAFAFGPIDDPRGYGDKVAPFDVDAPSAASEWNLRAPVNFLGDIKRPVFVFESRHGNAEAARVIAQRAKKVGAPVEAYVLSGGDHFKILHPMTRLVARMIVADTGATPSFPFGTAASAP